jgi:hypothetical protein
MRRSLTGEEQHKIAGAFVDHLASPNWKIELEPQRESFGPAQNDGYPRSFNTNSTDQIIKIGDSMKDAE